MVMKKSSKVKIGAKVTLKPTKPGQKKITFKIGGLHASTGTPQTQKISSSKMKKALNGSFGTKAKRQAQFKKNVLIGKK